VPLLTQTERDYLNGTREFTKPQQRYIRCRLKKKLRLLGDELQHIGIPIGSSVAANTSGVAAGCNGPENGLALVAQPGRALPGGCNNSNEKEALGGIPGTFRRFRTRDLYLTKVTLYQAELPRQSNGRSSQ